jgi:hypothetical protein
MAMQTNLAKKDKITIAVLLFAALIFMVVWFLIKPTVSSIITTSDKIEQAELKQTEYKNKIMYLSSAEAIYGKVVDDLNVSTEMFYNIMDSAEIDRMVTSYVLKSGLFAENLKIVMPIEAVDEKPYVYSDLAAEDSGKSTSSSDSKKDKDSGTADTLLTPYNTARNKSKSTEPSGVQCVELTLVVTGTEKACQTFLDDISTKPAVRITGFEWGKVAPLEVYNEETGRTEAVDSGKVRLTISFNLYMADVADYDVVSE